MTATMKCPVHWYVALAVLLALPAQGALAQAIQNPLIVKREGTQVKSETLVFATIADCEENREFEFGVDYSTQAPIVEVWVGAGSTNCADTANRIRANAATTNPVCKLLGVDKQASAKPRIKVNAVDMFSKEWGKKSCDQLRNQPYTIFVIPLEQETNLDAAQATAPLTVGNISTLKAVFTLYTLRPDPPTNVRAVSGESSVGVKFTVQQGAQTLTNYKAYFDWGTGGAGQCGSGVLGTTTTSGSDDDDDSSDADVDAGATDSDDDAGIQTDAGVVSEEDDASVVNTSGVEPPDDDEPNVLGIETESGNVSLSALDDKGIAIGDYVAVSVVTLDAAENESFLTTPICVQRVQTAGFLDACEQDRKCRGGFDSCSVSPGVRTTGWLGLSLLLGAGVVFGARRRRQG